MSLPRLMDANANRAREALRVMEDAARFLLDDEPLTARLKGLRHELRAVLDRFPPGWMEASRDTPADVGTGVATPAERERAGIADVVVAAGKRLGEALRTLEEAAKTVDPDAAAGLEALRYRAYDVEAGLQRRLGSGRARQWRVCLLLTESLCRRPWPEVLAAALAAGVDCIQVREKAMAGGALAARVGAVIEAARPAGAAVIVNDRPDVALAAGADGVHLGQDDLSVADVRRLAGRSLLVGVSTHDPAEAAAAVAAGADYCGVGAMFATRLKPARAPSGAAYLRHFLDAHPGVPHLAIGGITADNAASLVEAGARGLAVSSAVCGADDPAAVVRRLRSLLAPVSVADA
ncbi:MAG: thiamine phosphate synthase [Planctomycetota bacterium]|jgi:thiamine-phosphate pyrophosphorylase